MKKLFVFVLLLAVVKLSAQHAQVYPTNWWTGMKWNKVQLLIRGENSLPNITGMLLKHRYVEDITHAKIG